MQLPQEFITEGPAFLWAVAAVCAMVMFYFCAWGWLLKRKVTASQELLRTIRARMTVGGLILFACFLVICGWLYANSDWQTSATGCFFALVVAAAMVLVWVGMEIAVRHLLQVLVEMQSASATRMLIAVPLSLLVLALAAESLCLLAWMLERSPAWMDGLWNSLIWSAIAVTLGALWASPTHTALILRALFLAGSLLIIGSAGGALLWLVARESSPLLVGLLFLAGVPIVLWYTYLSITIANRAGLSSPNSLPAPHV